MLKKTAIATAIALSMGTGSAMAGDAASATFTMLSGGGGLVGLFTDVVASLDSTAGTFAVASTSAFFGLQWTAHDGVTFGPGSYTFDTAANNPGTIGDTYTSVTVGASQVGGHVLFDYGTTVNIDVVMVWDVTDNGDGTSSYYSIDNAGFAVGGAVLADGYDLLDGVRGNAMADGAFPTFNANFDLNSVSAVPVPAAVWLFGSGLLGLVGVARRKKAA